MKTDPNRIAAIWQDGPPPKDGSYILAVFGNGPPVVVRWGDLGDVLYAGGICGEETDLAWLVVNNDDHGWSSVFSEQQDPIKWAEITGW